MKINKLKQNKIFVLWKYHILDDGKKTKIPMRDPINKASSTNQSHWRLYKECKEILNKNERQLNGIGIVFDNTGLVGIDIDKIFNFVDYDKISEKTVWRVMEDINKETKQSPIYGKLLEFLENIHTYTELSPSGTGLHLFFYVTDIEKLVLTNNKIAPFEVYSTKRYFTLTENVLSRPESGVDEDEIMELTSKQFTDILKNIELWNEDLFITNNENIENNINNDLEILQNDQNDQKGKISKVSKNGEKEKKEYKTVSKKIEDDTDLLNRIFRTRIGTKLRNLFNGDTSDYGGDDSKADLALCSYLAFFTDKDSARIERIWLASPLGKREKTQKRNDYRDSTIKKALLNPLSAKREEGIVATKDDIGMVTVFKNNKISYPLNVENIHRILMKHEAFRDQIYYDEFLNRIIYKKSIIDDVSILKIMSKIVDLFPDHFSMVTKEMVRHAIQLTADYNKKDSAVEYLKNIKWDNKDRLDNWLNIVYGTENTSYVKEVGANFIKGIVARIIYPGCKLDTVLVLEGEQSIGKSTSLQELARDWYVETTLSVDNKDFFLIMDGKALVEFSEGETLSRSEVKKLKSIITTQKDTYRAPYEHEAKDHPRRCVFAMTTNENKYLKDETGNRRWLPIKVVKKADINWIKENRDQLFAEAYIRVVNNNEKWYITNELILEEAKKQQKSRLKTAPNTDLILRFIGKKQLENKINDTNRGFTIREVYRYINNSYFDREISYQSDSEISKVLSFLECEIKVDEQSSITKYYITERTPKVKFDIAIDINDAFEDKTRSVPFDYYTDL